MSGGPDGGVAGSAGPGFAWRLRRPGADGFVDHPDGVRRLEAPGDADNQRCGEHVFLEMAAAVVGREREHGLLAPGNIPAQRMVWPHQRVERDLHVVLGVVLVHAQLFDDHLAFLRDLGGVQRGAQKHVGEHRHGQTQLRRGHPRPEDRRLAIGGGVEHTADAFDRLADVARGRVALATFEHHVLDEMADAALGLGLVARTDADHERDRNRRAAGEWDCRQPGSPGQGFDGEFGQYDRPADRP